MKKNKLKIGLLIENYGLPAWSYKMVELIQNSTHSEVVLVVKKNSIKKNEGGLKELWRKRSHFLFKVFVKFENRFFKKSEEVFGVKNLKNIISCPEIKVTTKETKFYDEFATQDIKELEKHDVDVFVRLGFKILKGDILKSSRYGVWSYHHGNPKVNRGGPSGVWEVLEGWDVTGVSLQILTKELDGGDFIYESDSYTDKLSVNRNKNKYYIKGIKFLPRKLSELYENGEELFFERVRKINSEPTFYYNRLYKTPSNGEMLKGIFRIYLKKIKENIESIFYFKQWILLFRLETKETISRSFYKFKRITPPKDRIWADPFILYRNNTYYIFFEEMLHSENKGKISVIKMDEQGNYGDSQVVLETDFHLSYPFLYEENEVLYMIPESGIKRNVQLYKCIEFPAKWELVKTLIDDVNIADSTIYKNDGKYWLFANIREISGGPIHEELFLFYTDNLITGDWTPHPQNPIVSDVSSSRPAGKLFQYQGKLYRPAQNCSKRYGYGIMIKEVTVINENEYQERQVQSLHPNWAKDLLGVHTLNSTKKLTVIDALIKRRK